MVNILIGKINDAKEVVRSEVERLIIDISFYMSTEELVFRFLSLFEGPKLNDFGKKTALQIIMILLLKENQNTDEQFPRQWGQDDLIRDDLVFKKKTDNSVGAYDDNQDWNHKADQNIYLRLTEPLIYIYQMRSQKPINRYYA